MSAKGKSEQFYVVNYRDPVEDKIVSLKAKKISDSSLGLAFVRISDFVFDSDLLVVKPEEEALKKKFEDVKSLHLSIYSIVSIMEVGKRHRGLKFENDKCQLVVLPTAGPDGGRK